MISGYLMFVRVVNISEDVWNASMSVASAERWANSRSSICWKSAARSEQSSFATKQLRTDKSSPNYGSYHSLFIKYKYNFVRKRKTHWKSKVQVPYHNNKKFSGSSVTYYFYGLSHSNKQSTRWIHDQKPIRTTPSVHTRMSDSFSLFTTQSALSQCLQRFKIKYATNNINININSVSIM